MNFFKKNLLVVAPLIIATFLLSMIPCVGGLQDMTRSHKLRGAAKSGAAAEFFLPSSSSATRYLHHQPVQLRHASPPQSVLSTSNNFHHAPIFYQDQAHLGEGAEAGAEESFLSYKSPEVVRVYRLYNRRASHDILIQDNKVSATGTNLDEKGDLGLESVLKGNVVRTRIRGILNDKYICFNKKGRLVLRPKKKARGDKCEFIEESTEAGSRFSSALEPRWHIGFTTKGQALNGAAFDPNQSAAFACPSCFLFLKTSTYHKDKYPSNITQNNFDTLSHNRAIGQLHPGLSPEDFLSDFKFPFQPTAATSAPPASRPVPDPSPFAPEFHHRHLKLPHRRRTRRKKLQSKSSPQNSISSSGSSAPKQSTEGETEPQISISSKYGVIPDSKNNSISRISYNAAPINQLIYNSSLIHSSNSSLPSYRGRIDRQPESSRRQEHGDIMKELPEPQAIQFIPPQNLPGPPPPVPALSPSTSTLPPSTTSSAPSRNIARLRRVKKTHRKPNQTLHSNSRHNSNRNSNLTSSTTTTSRRPTISSTTTPAPTMTSTTTTTSRPTTTTSFSKPTNRHRRRHRHHHHYSRKNHTAADETATPNTARPQPRKHVPTTATTSAPQTAEFISKFPRWR